MHDERKDGNDDKSGLEVLWLCQRGLIEEPGAHGIEP